MSIDDRLDRIEVTQRTIEVTQRTILEWLRTILERETIRDFYPIDEFARLVGKAEFTCREWCRLGRIKAQKRQSGRGAHTAWVVPHAELLRYRQHGLLPQPRPT